MRQLFVAMADIDSETACSPVQVGALALGVVAADRSSRAGGRWMVQPDKPMRRFSTLSLQSLSIETNQHMSVASVFSDQQIIRATLSPQRRPTVRQQRHAAPLDAEEERAAEERQPAVSARAVAGCEHQEVHEQVNAEGDGHRQSGTCPARCSSSAAPSTWSPAGLHKCSMSTLVTGWINRTQRSA